MPDNFDKLLKDKLNSFEAPYVEGDWNKMEQLLDNEKGAGWLPLLWAFVFGLLAIASLWLIPNERVEQANIMNNAPVAFAEMNPAHNTDAGFSPAANVGDKTVSADEDEQTTSGNELKDTEPVLAENSTGELNPVDERNKPSGNARKNKASKNSEEQTANYDSVNGRKTVSFQGNKNNSAPFFAGSGKKEQTKNSSEQPIEFSGSNPFWKFPFIERELALPLLNEDIFSALPDKVPATSAKRKYAGTHLITGAIGMEGGINESFITKSSFAKPGYNLGITEELMFLKRIGISSSQLFSQVNYTTSETNCPEGVFCPLEVSSVFRKFEVTVDIKANLINTAKWSYYVKAGIQNNFKLQETLTLNYPAIPVPSDTNSIPTIPTSSFTGNATEDAVVKSNNVVPYPSEQGFSAFGEKKYYLAYHAATGFQYHLKKNFSLQMEAGYFISHHKPEYLGKRLQSLNVNIGIVYGLGR